MAWVDFETAKLTQFGPLDGRETIKTLVRTKQWVIGRLAAGWP